MSDNNLGNKNCNISNSLLNKIVSIIAVEINKKESQILIRERIVTPIINMIYKELYPYIIGLSITIIIILIITILTFVCFVLAYLNKL